MKYRTSVTCPICAETWSVPFTVDRYSGGQWEASSIEAERAGPCEACGADAFTPAQEDALHTAAVSDDAPTRDDYAPEFDDE